jgi:hypothetical protein
VYPFDAPIGTQKLDSIQNIPASQQIIRCRDIPGPFPEIRLRQRTKERHSSTMAFPLPHHVGEQDWNQPENEDRERGEHNWIDGMVPEQIERLPQLNAGQVPPGVYLPPGNCNYHISTNGVAYNYGSTPTPLNAENTPAISNPYIQANASSPTVPRWFREPSVLPVAQGFPQGNCSSEVLEPIYQYVQRELTPKGLAELTIPKAARGSSCNWVHVFCSRPRDCTGGARPVRPIRTKH